MEYLARSSRSASKEGDVWEDEPLSPGTFGDDGQEEGDKAVGDTPPTSHHRRHEKVEGEEV